MDVDSYRLAYNVLFSNWTKFGIPSEDIPPPKTETVDSLDPIIPGFSTAVALFQIASRKNFKTFLDNECPTAHNLEDIYTRFKNIMKEVLAKDTVLRDSPNSEDIVSPDTVVEDSPNSDVVSQDTMEEYLSEDSLEAMKERVLDIMNEDLPEDAVKEDLLEDNTKEGLPENASRESPTGNTIHSEHIPIIMAYSLAVCTELVLYERENENNKKYMKHMPDMWKEYFDKCLKPHCNKVRYTQDHLKDYSNSIYVPEEFVNKFISENKNEYDDIADKFFDYTEKHAAEKSPKHSQLKTEVGSLSKGMSFVKMKEKFAAFKEICNCFSKNEKGKKPDKIQLLKLHSTSSSNSTPTSS